MHDPDTRHEWVSVKQAAIVLGTSESDVRRRIRRGELESESLSRPGGTLLRVRLPASPDTAAIESEATPDTRQDIASGLLERLTAMDATIAAKDAEIARLNAQALTLAERAAAAEALAAARAAELERERARRWWRWW